jgi:TPR repeat protein
MKSLIAFLALMLSVSLAAQADDMADAAKAFEAKSYAQAMQLYTKMANAGNSAAQFHLGEMYWYGEGTPVDLVKADELFRKAAASGNGEAKAALGVMKQRELRKADIAYWTGAYDGAELKAAGAACQPPVIPAVSKNNDEIKLVSESVAKWQSCYNAFVDQMNDALPAGKRIPADISTLMNEQEYTQSSAHLDQLYAKISAAETARAKATFAAYQQWMSATEGYAAEHNKGVSALKLAERRNIEAMQRQFERGGLSTRSPTSMQR